MSMQAEPRPSIRFYHKDDGGCSWKTIASTLCGSCGCVWDSDDENSLAESDSNEDTPIRHINVSITQRGMPVAISSMTIMEGARAIDKQVKESENCCTRCCICLRRRKLQSDSILMTGTLDPATKRVIKINDEQETKFASNLTTTAKYSCYSFLPIFLYEQFRRYSNLFFLCMAILQQIPGVSPTGRYVTILPLLFILTVSAIKEIVEDTQRHRADRESNNRKVEVLKHREWKNITWAELSVGDIVKVSNGQPFPADLLLLSSSKSDGMCFIETLSLDGEINLKVKQAAPETININDAKKLSEMRGRVECEPPNRRIYDFIGVIYMEGFENPIPLGPNQMLQRGAALSSTEWIHGFVIYSGHDTKLMKNFARAPLKSSSVDVLMNKQVITLFILFLAITTLSAAMYMAWNYTYCSKHIYINIARGVDVVDLGFSFITFLILYNNLIPISLQVSLEMVRFCQASFINNDVLMYHAETDTPAQARTSNLNEELGMVKYVLTDKTGTLTCNIMKFKNCSIAGIIYEVPEEESVSVNESDLAKNIRQGHPTAQIIEEFMLAITLCHSVISEIKEDGSIVYHATNPDDQAIIEGIKNFGFEYITRTSEYLEIKRFGETQRYELLQTIEFTSSRKRMSVLVRNPAGEIKLYCKGADSIIYERLSELNDPDNIATTKNHLDRLAALGLRTLCCAVTNISEERFASWNFEYRTAMSSLVDREANIEYVADEIEKNLMLLGVTAIEDKLQDGVPETISALLKADIKVWMLTGDKQETAINIGFSSGLLQNHFNLVIINEENMRDTYVSLNMQRNSSKDLRNSALVIDGKTLQFALSRKLRSVFKQVCIKCRVVVCCRLSPIQKGEIAELVNSTGACTLAIGDGANDVAMIRKARVGVGISGVEGLQAACASDYSIAQFRFLRRLLFVHGTWNYRRITTTILYAFYKNIFMCIIQLWYCIYSGWSAQILFDNWSIAGYNVIFSAMPPMVLGIFDKVCNAEALIRYPRIYRRAHDAKLFNVGIFWVWILNAVLHSLLLFFLTIWILYEVDIIWPSGINADMMVIGHTVYTATVATVCLKAGITMHSWNVLTHIAIWGSILLWYIFVIAYSYCWPALPVGSQFVRLHERLFSSSVYWLLMILLPAVTLLPDFFFKVYYNTYFITITEVARHGDKQYSRQHSGRLTRLTQKLKRATLLGYV